MNPFSTLIDPTELLRQSWPDDRRTVHSLETEADYEPFEECKGTKRVLRLYKVRTPERAARLERIKELLIERRRMTAQEIALAVGVKQRAIWKDMQQLQAEGFPVQGITRLGYEYQGER